MFHSETDLVVAVARTQLLAAADLSNVAAVQSGYKVTPLSVFIGKEPVAAAPLEWLAWDREKAESIGFIEYLNFFLGLSEPIHAQDQPAMERFAIVDRIPAHPLRRDSLLFSEPRRSTE